MARTAERVNEGRWTWQQIKSFVLKGAPEPICRARGAERGEMPEGAVGVNFQARKKE